MTAWSTQGNSEAKCWHRGKETCQAPEKATVARVPASDSLVHVLVACLLCAGHCVLSTEHVQQRPMGGARKGFSEEWRLEL